MSSDRKKTHLRQSAEQNRSESEEQLSLLQTITSELATAGDLPAALEVVLRDICHQALPKAIRNGRIQILEE